jgi:hypothetical protein
LKYHKLPFVGFCKMLKRRSDVRRQKAGPETGSPRACLPLHQLFIFPGYSSKRTNEQSLPEKSEKIFHIVFAGVFALYREIRARRSPRPITRLASPTPKAAVTPK